MDIAVETNPSYTVAGHQSYLTRARAELQRFENDNRILTAQDIERRMARIFDLAGLQNAPYSALDVTQIRNSVEMIDYVLELGAMHHLRAGRSYFFEHILPCAKTAEPVPEGIVESVKMHVAASRQPLASLDKSGQSDDATIELAFTDPAAALRQAPWLARKGKTSEQAFTA